MPVHQNYIESSNLMSISIGLGFVNLLFTPEAFSSAFAIFITVFTFLFLIGLATLTRKGISWIKHVFLVMMILGSFSIYFIVKNLEQNPIVGTINIIQTVLQAYSLYLLYKIPNESA